VTQPGDTEVCGCLAATNVQSSHVGSTSAGIERVEQVIDGSATLEGTPTYGVWVDHQSPSGTGHYMDFRLFTDQGGYYYTASGTLVDRALTDWSGWRYTYRGTYRLTSRPGSSEAMTSSGTYTLVLSASWEQNRVVAADFTIADGS
jgi:hypothetical protein